MPYYTTSRISTPDPQPRDPRPRDGIDFLRGRTRQRTHGASPALGESQRSVTSVIAGLIAHGQLHPDFVALMIGVQRDILVIERTHPGGQSADAIADQRPAKNI